MNINDEAVEAAAKVWLRLSLKQGSWTLEGNVRAALEAAAPHLMAVAWERGREDGYHHRPNPYRSAGAGE